MTRAHAAMRDFFRSIRVGNEERQMFFDLEPDTLSTPSERRLFGNPANMVMGFLRRGPSFDGSFLPGGPPGCNDFSALTQCGVDCCPSQTIILFDWDDTLAPTTAMKDLDLSPCRRSPSAPTPLKMCELSDAVVGVLLTARQFSKKVVIVTNAHEGWVEATCEAWMPALLPLLHSCDIVSARSVWEPRGVRSPLDWKVSAFRDVLTRFYTGPWKNVISVGDSTFERQALFSVMESAHHGCWAKAVKFDEEPTIERLSKELQLLSLELRQLVEHRGRLDLNVDDMGLSLRVAT